MYSPISPYIALPCALLLYFMLLAIYRLYFSPISHIPGPKAAAITLWYEFYYDCILRGQYIFKIEKLHEQYGPIIRINPWEIHIFDSDFYEEIYAVSGRRRDRWSWSVAPGGFTKSTGGTAAHDHHRLRRSALNPFFSKGNIRKLQYPIDERVQSLVDSFDKRKGGEPFRLEHAFAALTNDVVMEYAFGHNHDRIGHPEYDPEFHDNFVAGATKLNLLRHLPWLDKGGRMIPSSLLARFSPVVAQFLKEKEEITEEVRVIMSAKSDHVSTGYRTIYHEILSSRLPPVEKELPRLAEEAQITLGAGTIATARIMAVCCFYVLSPEHVGCLETLRSELRDAIPDTSAKDAFELTKLEKLPYLTACINEALRLGNGTTTRLQRIAPDETLVFTDKESANIYHIPSGTPVSISTFLTHRRTDLFPDPCKFNPNRWIENPKLVKYLLPFSKGGRQCIGVHLAYAEMYLTLARVFRRYGSRFLPETDEKGHIGILELHDTTERDVVCVADLMVPAVAEGSQGVRVKVTA